MTQHRFRHACCDVRSINAVTMFQCADEVAPVSTQLAQFRRMDSVTSVSMLPFQRWKHVLHNGDHSSVFLWRHNVHIATYRQNVSES